LREPRRAMAAAGAAGALSSGAGVALTALSGWLIVSAAGMPPILTLMVAIVGVRACGLARAGLRWTERLASHDAALRLAADALVLGLAVGVVLWLHRRVDAGAARAESTLRVAALQETATALDGAADLRAHGLSPRLARTLTDGSRTAAAAARTGARAGAIGTGV